MTGLNAYLSRQGIDADRDVSDLTEDEARELVVETAYYRACLSDSTYHGVNHGAKVTAVSNAVRRYPQFTVDDFAELDEATDERIAERKGVSA